MKQPLCFFFKNAMRQAVSLMRSQQSQAESGSWQGGRLTTLWLDLAVEEEAGWRGSLVASRGFLEANRLVTILPTEAEWRLHNHCPPNCYQHSPNYHWALCLSQAPLCIF